MLIRIAAPYFVAGIILVPDLFGVFSVVKAAPILRYMKGWSYSRVFAYCNQKNWEILELKEGNVWEQPMF